MAKQNNNKLHKVVKVTSIIGKVMLALCGVAVLAFFAWLGYKIYLFFGV